MFLLTVLGVVKDAIAVILVFLVCVVIHELGHFLVAKRFGVAVPAFAVGFGPKLWKWVRGGTEFSIRLLPLGGMVQLAGEVPQDALFRRGEQIAVLIDSHGRITMLGDPADIPRGEVGRLVDLDLTHNLTMTLDFGDGPSVYPVMPHAKLVTGPRNSMPIVARSEQVLGKPVWQRAAMILAGPAMNFLLAAVLFGVYLMQSGIFTNAPLIGGVEPGSVAAAAGLQRGDKVVAINGHPISNWQQLVSAIQSDTARPPQPLALDIQRDGQALHKSVTPALVRTGPQLGIEAYLDHNPVRAMRAGFSTVYYTSVRAVQLYGHIIRYHDFSNLSGPVGIANVISSQAQQGVWHVVMIAGLLSLNLGLFNLLPFPALDGGRLLFMVFEMIRGKAVDPRKESLVHFVGFALLMLFAVIITYRDVTRLF